jgi:ATP adenylyltransferase
MSKKKTVRRAKPNRINIEEPRPPGRKSLIAPWRSDYIFSPKKPGCFFCEACALPDGDEAAWKAMLLLHRSEHGLVIMNKYPYTGGHLLIAPRRHTADLPGLTREESAYLWEFTRKAVGVIDGCVHAQGYNVGMNLGRAAGAGVEDHLHMHALPRWQGDTNFMHIVAGTSTVPVALEALWDQMRPVFAKCEV